MDPTIQKYIRVVLLVSFALCLSCLSKNDFHEIFGSRVYQLTHDIGGLALFTWIIIYKSKAISLPKPIKLLDEHSFSIYLVHFPIMIICFGFFYPNLWISIFASLISLVLAALVFDYLTRTGKYYIISIVTKIYKKNGH